MTAKTILFPTDFSEASATAFEYAEDFARGSHGRLLIVHVQEPIYPLVGGELAYLPSTQTNPEELAAELRKIVPNDSQLTYAHQLLQGDPATEIVNLAKSEHADMIILGTHGRTGVARLLLGSTAEQVLRRAPCPVLAVKQPAHEPVHA